jgi:hypothetical protein
MLRSDDLERLIINYTRRLQMLKEQKAIMGISADPRILIEIEDIEAEIENLQKERSLSESLEERLDQQMLGWFQTLGYRFESYRIRNEDYSEWVINIPARRGYERILVRGVNGEALLPVQAVVIPVDKHSTRLLLVAAGTSVLLVALSVVYVLMRRRHRAHVSLITSSMDRGRK